MPGSSVTRGHWRLPVVAPVLTPPQSQAFVEREVPSRPGVKETQLRALWTPRVRARLWHPRHWGDALHLRRHYDTQELDPTELKLDFPVGRLPDCDSCEEVCCTGPHRVVLLRLVDVAALLDAGMQHVMTLEKPVFGDAELRRNPALWDMVHSAAWRCMPVLKQDSTGTCSLLTANNRCGAYPAWPLSCARFPYALDIQRSRIFYARSCNSVVQDATRQGRARERGLWDAVVEGYNQRLRDAVLLRVAQRELSQLGLGAYVRWP